MKKEKNIIKIGEEFKKTKNIEQGYYTEFKTLSDCYGKWSDAKQNVFYYYKNLLVNNCNKVLEYGIRSFNCNVIVLHSIIKKGNKKYYLVITPNHNWIKEI